MKASNAASMAMVLGALVVNCDGADDYGSGGDGLNRDGDAEAPNEEDPAPSSSAGAGDTEDDASADASGGGEAAISRGGAGGTAGVGMPDGTRRRPRG